jgi:hypothetical protein
MSCRFKTWAIVLGKDCPPSPGSPSTPPIGSQGRPPTRSTCAFMEQRSGSSPSHGHDGTLRENSGEMSALAPAPAFGCDQASLRSNRFNAVAMISSDRLRFCSALSPGARESSASNISIRGSGVSRRRFSSFSVDRDEDRLAQRIGQQRI